MKQTPIHENHNDALLRLIPTESKNVVEIGCSSGALAREFKRHNPNTNWIGIEIDPGYAELAKRYCDETYVLNLEKCDQTFYDSHINSDCWIFGDVLEHFKDPWSVLRRIRNIIPSNGSVVACIPNAQNWSVITRLATGDFRYEDVGLLDRTHLRWFTRKTMHELFESGGFRIADGFTTISFQPNKDIIELIGKIAEKCGADPSAAMLDAVPLQYAVRVVPV